MLTQRASARTIVPTGTKGDTMENRLERVAQVALKLTSRTQAVRLWNWIDSQRDCDALWAVMVDQAPQFFKGADPNSIFWHGTFVRAVRVSNDMEWATMTIHRDNEGFFVLRSDQGDEWSMDLDDDATVQATLDRHNTDDICWEVC